MFTIVFSTTRLFHHRISQKKQLVVPYFTLCRKRIQLLKNDHMILCRQNFHRKQLSSANTIKNEEKEEDEKEPVSLIAKKLLKSQLPTQTHLKVKAATFSTEDTRLKLENLTKDLKSSDKYDLPSNDNYEENTEPVSIEKKEVNEIEDQYALNDLGEEDFIENFVLKQDLHNRPKPSPLLGTEDQTVPISNIPCVGCGALLHCQHRTMPGFLPSERFKLLSKPELRSSICQRCYYIQHCDAFVEVKSNPEDYAEIIAQIKPTRSVIVMVIDVTDIRGSIVPNLTSYVGQHHPLIIVGNKADLIAPDCSDYLVKVKEAIMQTCSDMGLENIRKVMLISAKTGFGIERLINTLFSVYKNNVDVFIVGTANAGKSSLFNTLLASDYCRQRARDLIQRATVSVWPGTTLNLLKFPIMCPSQRILKLRQRRLTQQKAIKKELLTQKKQNRKRSDQQEKWQLKEDITTTDLRTHDQIEKDYSGKPWGQEVVSYKGDRNSSIITPSTRESPFTPETFDQSHYTQSYWVYDTPGVINPDQTFNLLEPNECSPLQSATMATPRCVLLKPGTCVFISGLARLDYVQGSESMMITVHCSPNLPIRVMLIDEADQYYLQHVGSPELGVPVGDRERLNRLPSLVAKDIVVEGHDDRMAVADVQLSSIGWVSLAPRFGCMAKLRAYTPGRKGIHLRCPSLLPRFLQFKGKRISGTPFFWPKQVGSMIFSKTLPSDENEI